MRAHTDTRHAVCSMSLRPLSVWTVCTVLSLSRPLLATTTAGQNVHKIDVNFEDTDIFIHAPRSNR